MTPSPRVPPAPLHRIRRKAYLPAALLLTACGAAQTASAPPALMASGTLTSGAVLGDHVPRSEVGIGALMPWADRLWFVAYVAHKKGSGGGIGLYEMDASFNVKKRPESVVGTYANRMIHKESNQLSMGPYLIDPKGKIRIIKGAAEHRLTATMRHLSDPANKIYLLGMEGHLIEADVNTLESRVIDNLTERLGIKGKPHWKGGYTGLGRVIVANNSYFEPDETGTAGHSSGGDGRLAEWDGNPEMNWKILERTAFVEVTGNGILENAIFAMGWDRSSVILRVLRNDQWKVYRLPKGNHANDQAWFTEWPRIREVETERLLMDMHGMFYELPLAVYGGHTWGIRPISSHLRMVGDFTAWRGMLVLAGNQTSSMWDTNHVGGQPQAGLWFGKTDDLWGFGKPSGWGGPWIETAVQKDEASVPYLMTGFDKKVLHLSHTGDAAVDFAIEVDFLGDGRFKKYRDVQVSAGGYEAFTFPEGFSAHWVRIRPNRACTATAQFFYN